MKITFIKHAAGTCESRRHNAGLQETHFKYDLSRQSRRLAQIHTAIPFVNNV
jgi:hypothetical protein